MEFLMKYRNNSFIAFLYFIGLSGSLICSTGIVNCRGLLIFTNGVANLFRMHTLGLLPIGDETQTIIALISLLLMAFAAWVIWEGAKRYNSSALIWYYLSMGVLFLQRPPLLSVHRLIPFTFCVIFALCISKTFVLFYKENKLAALLIFPITLLSIMSVIAAVLIRVVPNFVPTIS